MQRKNLDHNTTIESKLAIVEYKKPSVMLDTEVSIYRGVGGGGEGETGHRARLDFSLV